MRRPIVIAVLILDLVIVTVLFYSNIKNFFIAHTWWENVLATSPEIALAVFAWIESRHSGEANTFRAEANELRYRGNKLQDRIGELTCELNAERNKHLQQIADNTARAATKAERNAKLLRQYIGSRATVSEPHGEWGAQIPEIVDINDQNILTLFVPFSHSSSGAWCLRADCEDLEIYDIPQGNLPIRIKILKRYGDAVQLGQITRWIDRNQPAAIPIFVKGDVAYKATFNKAGSSERRSLAVFTCKDGSNSFLLEPAHGEIITGDNVEISKRFMMLVVEYEAEGFTRNSCGTGASPYRLYIHMN